MKKSALAWLAVSAFLILQGCGASGEISSDQQKAKRDALQKVADEHPDPNREVRPQ